MVNILRILLTLIIGSIGGYIFLKLKVPAGGIIGAMLFTGIFNIITSQALAPFYFKLFAQSIAGAYIAIPITLDNIKAMRKVFIPSVIVIVWMLIISIILALGCVATAHSNLDLLTSFFMSAPGGMSDIVLIANEVGADTAQVSIIHIIRTFFVLGILPITSRYIAILLEKKYPEKFKTNLEVHKEKYQKLSVDKNKTNFFITLLVALLSGWMGFLSVIPGGALSFSMIFVTIFNLITKKGYMPLSMRRFAQMCAGVLIGSTITRGSIANTQYILAPLIIILSGNVFINIVLGLMLFHYSELDLRSCLFATIPAGVADMALMADEFSGEGAEVALVQTIRLVSVVILFPQVYLFLASL